MFVLRSLRMFQSVRKRDETFHQQIFIQIGYNGLDSKAC